MYAASKVKNRQKKKTRILGLKGKGQTEEEKGYEASKVKNRQKKNKDMQHQR